ncbi:MAG TPA: metallophosphoesterase, partial [Bacteroidales bacterium]|nr:metallophosphoesterase [Bacteroidales bacterium]
MNKFAYLFSLCLFLSTLFLSGQAGSFSFALITDTHIGSGSADEDLRRTVEDINDIDSVVFVIVAGDVTEFGSDAELLLAKKILDRLEKPWYIIPGSHDTKWSESGANSFRIV